MDFLNLAKKRYSVRAYQKKSVAQETIDKILQAGWVAPTAANLQPNKFLVLNDEQSLSKLAKGTNTHGALWPLSYAPIKPWPGFGRLTRLQWLKLTRQSPPTI